MSATDFRSAIKDYIREEAKPVDKFSHQTRLYELTCKIGAGRSYDDDVVFAAVWLHDLGVFIGHRPKHPAELAKWDSVAYAMKRTPQLLRQFGFPTKKIAAVVEAIRTHQPQENPTSLEGMILRDADILEQLGATSILRTVSKIGRDTRFTVFPDALRVLQKNVATLPDQLRLPKTKQLAATRVTALKSFLEATRREHCAAVG